MNISHSVADWALIINIEFTFDAIIINYSKLIELYDLQLWVITWYVFYQGYKNNCC